MAAPPKRIANSTPAHALEQLNSTIVRCNRCPELRDYCAAIARDKRKAYANFDYWGKPVPAFGDPSARILIVGLAPGAHGANRTGRMFTGDRSGDFLYAALHRVGLASQPHATDRGDGLTLHNVYITAAQRCAPPGNKPTAGQLANCAGYLEKELAMIQPPVVICLGGIAWTATMKALAANGCAIPRPRPKFGHSSEVQLDGCSVLGCYHVSQQNTFTGRLTETMLDDILRRAVAAAA